MVNKDETVLEDARSEEYPHSFILGRNVPSLNSFEPQLREFI